MNDLIFLNHIRLLNFDPALRDQSRWNDYLMMYKAWVAPGVEYICSRSLHLNQPSPWRFSPTKFPIPALPIRHRSFDDIFDSLGAEIVDKIKQGRQIYLLWSGGIDSTLVLTSVLKHLPGTTYENFVVVCNTASQNENPVFYHRYVQYLPQMQFKDFCNTTLDLDKTSILTGEGGDQIFGHSIGNLMFTLEPDLVHKPWRSNQDILRRYWHSKTMPEFWDRFIEIMHQTVAASAACVETVYDFCWWVNYNFKFDSVMLRTPLVLGSRVLDQDYQKFCTKTICNPFADTRVQQWSLTNGSQKKLGSWKKSFKYPAKKYIYDFDHNEFYFREKRKEWSLPMDALDPMIAVDNNYQRYSLADRSVRQEIGRIFFENSK
jgi:hypothetical protein